MPAPTVSPGIDPRWLESLYRADPAAHALAVWDRQVWPHLVEFSTFVVAGSPRGYLLRWNGLPGCPVLHFGGRTEGLDGWAGALPERPFLAVLPPEISGAALRRGAPAQAFGLRLRHRPAAPAAADPKARRLGSADIPRLRAMAEADRSTVTDTYLSLDPAQDWIVGAFDGDRLVALARAEVRLPEVWHISGVYTRPEDRGRGWGEKVVRCLLNDAHAAGAATALFVREDNAPAGRLYDRLGFDRGDARLWIDAGAERPP